MSRRHPQARRYQVALRPKIVRRRLVMRGAALAMLALGVLAVLTFEHFRPAMAALWARFSVPADVRLEGVPAGLDRRVRSFIKSEGAAAAEQWEPLLKAFPVFSSVRVRRSWLRARTTFSFEMQRAVARLPDGSCLSDTGIAFEGSHDDCADPMPVVDASGAGSQELKSLGAALSSAERAGWGGLPVARMKFVSAAEGWKATLKDGTEVRWGGLSWTPEKLERLRQVLDDARKSKPGVMQADLRYFEDGKIILRQVK